MSAYSKIWPNKPGFFGNHPFPFAGHVWGSWKYLCGNQNGVLSESNVVTGQAEDTFDAKTPLQIDRSFVVSAETVGLNPVSYPVSAPEAGGS